MPMKHFLLLCFAILCGCSCFAQSLADTWSGTLRTSSVNLAIVLHLQESGNAYTCTLDSPDQNAYGIAAEVLLCTADSLSVRLPSIGATYCGHSEGDTLKGRFTQMGFPLPLDLQRGEQQTKRPQTPQPPYPYVCQEVTFRNTADGATLAGTLTFPQDYKSGDSVPFVLLVSGSGQQDRDETLFQHKPFLVLADYFARHGIGSLRYDDRATGASVGGDLQHATTADFARDAAAGLDLLRRTGAASVVGVLGHSEGASIAFMLAAAGKADFVVSMAGIGVKGDTALTAQVNHLSALRGGNGSTTVGDYRRNVAALHQPWLDFFIDYDPTADLRATHCPVFAANGDKDCQVIASLNLPAIERALPKNAANICRTYTGLNHLFQPCTTGDVSEYGAIETTLSVDFLDDVADWILRLAH